MQDPSVRGLSADLTPENCTIAHIAVVLVAVTAAKSGYKNKIADNVDESTIGYASLMKFLDSFFCAS